MRDEDRFSYSSAPQAIKPTHKKYRDENAANLMCDPRIVRGNTHAIARKIATIASSSGPNPASKTKSENIITADDSPSQSHYRFNVTAIVNGDIDISSHLIDSNDGAKKSTTECDSQTDSFLPKIATPRYIPRKTGIDRSTQVEDVRELFNFDLEVAPILDVIVKKTIEQSLFEVKSEEDILKLVAIQNEYHDIKSKEQEWVKQQITEAQKESKQKNAKYCSEAIAVQKNVACPVACCGLSNDEASSAGYH